MKVAHDGKRQNEISSVSPLSLWPAQVEYIEQQTNRRRPTQRQHLVSFTCCSMAESAAAGHVVKGMQEHCPISSNVVKGLTGARASKQTFNLHEAVVKKHSEFFAAALKRERRECRERIAQLPDEDTLRLRPC